METPGNNSHDRQIGVAGECFDQWFLNEAKALRISATEMNATSDESVFIILNSMFKFESKYERIQRSNV